MNRLVTPTGVLITSALPESEEWLQARRDGLTATDLPKILGVSQYGTALDVWTVKTGTMPDPFVDNEYAQWGQLLEDVIAREGARRDGISVRRVGVLANRDEPWQRASLDRLTTGCTPGERCGVEVKTRSAYVAGRWRDDVPDDTLAQVVWQLHVTGLDHMHVYALLGGNRLEQHVIRRTDVTDVEAMAVTAATDLWQHIQDGTRPDVNPTPALVDSLNRLFTTRDGTVVADDTALTWRDEYLSAAADVKAAEGRKKTAQAALMQALGPATEAVSRDGKRLWSVTASSRTSVDIPALTAAYGTAVIPYLRTSTSSRFNPPKDT